MAATLDKHTRVLDTPLLLTGSNKVAAPRGKGIFVPEFYEAAYAYILAIRLECLAAAPDDEVLCPVTPVVVAGPPGAGVSTMRTYHVWRVLQDWQQQQLPPHGPATLRVALAVACGSSFNMVVLTFTRTRTGVSIAVAYVEQRALVGDRGLDLVLMDVSHTSLRFATFRDTSSGKGSVVAYCSLEIEQGPGSGQGLWRSVLCPVWTLPVLLQAATNLELLATLGAEAREPHALGTVAFAPATVAATDDHAAALVAAGRAQVEQRYHMFGGIPRACFGSPTTLRLHHGDVTRQAQRIVTRDRFNRLVINAILPECHPDCTSHLVVRVHNVMEVQHKSEPRVRASAMTVLRYALPIA